MKAQQPHTEQYSITVVDASTMDQSIGKFFDAIPRLTVVKNGKRRFTITETTVERERGNVRKPVTKNAPQRLCKIETSKLYNEYHLFYESEYAAFFKKYGLYRAQTYAAKQTIEKIRTEKGTVRNVRQVIEAMNRR